MVAPLAEVTRGSRVESLHSGVIVVADHTGTVMQASGDPDTFAFFRSSAKPFQAIPFVESGAIQSFGFTESELALVCASHTAEQHHQDQVDAMLEKLGLRADQLQCGCPLPWNRTAAAEVLTGNRPRSPLQCDCSGKHTGMLAVCCAEGFALDTYLEPNHPLQQNILQTVAEICQFPVDRIEIAPDGCSVPTFGMPVSRFAVAYASLAAPETRVPHHSAALGSIRKAMTTYPYNVGGAGIFASDLMAVFDGEIVAKNGAEGLLCIGIPAAGLGIAIRVADGSFRAHPAAAIKVLSDLGPLDEARLAQLEEKHPPVIRNHNGWEVGEIQSVAKLRPVESVR